MIEKLIRSFFRPGVNTSNFSGNIAKVPAGLVADNSAMWGLLGLIANLDAIDLDIVALATGTQTAVTLTGAQAVANVLDHSGSPGGTITVTLPTAAQIIAALPITIPADGFNFELYYLNDSMGQTVQLAAGTGVTIVGTSTIATATTRFYIVNVNVNAGTVSYVNIGSMSL